MTQRYDTYKDSGVQWLGEIPGHKGIQAATHQRCSNRTNKSMLSYGHIKNRTIIVDWLVKEDKRAIELDNENTNVKPIPGSWNTVFNREVEQLFIILV